MTMQCLTSLQGGYTKSLLSVSLGLLHKLTHTSLDAFLHVHFGMIPKHSFSLIDVQGAD